MASSNCASFYSTTAFATSLNDSRLQKKETHAELRHGDRLEVVTKIMLAANEPALSSGNPMFARRDEGHLCFTWMRNFSWIFPDVRQQRAAIDEFSGGGRVFYANG